MNAFVDMRNDNIKFNATPLLNKIDTKFAFESEIFKALKSFHNKINGKKHQQSLNFKNNSSTHISCTNNKKKLINNNITILNKYDSTKQNFNTNQINKYNFKSSLINDIIKSNSNKNKCSNKNSEDNIVKRNINNFPLRIYKTSFNSNIKNPNKLKIEVGANNINYFNTQSNNNFSNKSNNKKKTKIQKIKNENNKSNYNINVVTNYNYNHRIFKKHPNKINILNKNSVFKNYENNSCRKENKNKFNYNINIFNSNNNNYDICKNNDSKLYNNICRSFIKYKQNKKKFLSVNNLNEKISGFFKSPNIKRNKTKNIISSKINNNYVNFYSLINSEKNLKIKFNTVNNAHSNKNNILKKITFKTQNSFYKPSISDINKDTKNKNNKNLDKNNLVKNPTYPNNCNSCDNKYLTNIKNSNSYGNNKFICQSNDKLTINNKRRDNYNNIVLNINDNNNCYEISNSDYKSKLSQIRNKTEGLLNTYYKLYKMISSDNIEYNKNDS